jgi:holin-like protein
MVGGLAVLLVFQVLGEVVVGVLALPIPGPVVGMVALFVALLVRGDVPQQLRTTAQTLLGHLSLLFIPAGAGIIAHVALLRAAWLPMLVTLLVSTWVTMAVTALVLRLLLRRRASAPGR